jgi:sugar phosphate isomerase/epimerase
VSIFWSCYAVSQHCEVSIIRRILSTYFFIRRKLNPALVAEFAAHGVDGVELFCSRGQFDYRSRDAVRELAGALRDNNITVHSIHTPSERDFSSNRESSVPLSICDLERTRRLEAVDEIKRALDMAEDMPFRYAVQHLGSSRDTADPRKFDAAFNSLEHLHLFAKQRGVTIALENTPGELATPANLRQFIADTRLTELRLCLDTGHAHIGGGIEKAFEVMRDLIVTTHIHDNHGEKDEHLFPYDGTIDWPAAMAELANTSMNSGSAEACAATASTAVQSNGTTHVPLVLELKEQPMHAEPAPAGVGLAQVRGAFDKLEEELRTIGSVR